MAVTFYELADSRGELTQSINSASVPLRWFAGQSFDENEVYDALFLLAPLVYDNLPRQSINLKSQLGGYWKCEVMYGFSAETFTDSPDSTEAPDDTTPLGPEFGFDITAETSHITQSIKTVLSVADGGTATWAGGTVYVAGAYIFANGNVYVCTTGGTSGGAAPSGTTGGIADGTAVWSYVKPYLATAPSYAGAIGVTKDRIEGTDIFTGHMEFTVTVQYYPILLPYLRTLLGMVGTVNNATWYQFPSGTLMYLGATGRCTPGSIWTLTHKFAAAPNITNLTIGNFLISLKRGFDYLWVAYRDAVSAAGFLVQVPATAYVEQVYRYTDYTTLGLGGP